MNCSSKPCISAIMPCHNREQYIGTAIESILSQTFSNFELIILDDGSTDDTWNEIQKFKDERIRSFQSPSNAGNYYLRNKG